MAEITDTFTEEIAAASRSLLGEQRKTVGGLAGHLHISRATASDRVNAGSAFTSDELPKVAAFFGLPDVYALIEIAEQISRRNGMAGEAA